MHQHTPTRSFLLSATATIVVEHQGGGWFRSALARRLRPLQASVQKAADEKAKCVRFRVRQRGFPDGASARILVEKTNNAGFKRPSCLRSSPEPDKKHAQRCCERAATSFVRACKTHGEETAVRTSRVGSVKPLRCSRRCVFTLLLFARSSANVKRAPAAA